MLIEVKFDIDSDIIDCPDDICGKIEKYQTEFLEWLFDKNVDHKYWCYENGKKLGCCYRADAFIEWLNQFVIDNNARKLKVVESNIRRTVNCGKTIYF